MNAADQFIQDLEDAWLGPQGTPDKTIQIYFGAARNRRDPEGLRQLAALQNFLDNQTVPRDIDPETLLLCRRMAAEMVNRGLWSMTPEGHFIPVPPEEEEER